MTGATPVTFAWQTPGLKPFALIAKLYVPGSMWRVRKRPSGPVATGPCALGPAIETIASATRVSFFPASCTRPRTKVWEIGRAHV